MRVRTEVENDRKHARHRLWRLRRIGFFNREDHCAITTLPCAKVRVLTNGLERWPILDLVYRPHPSGCGSVASVFRFGAPIGRTFCLSAGGASAPSKGGVCGNRPVTRGALGSKVSLTAGLNAPRLPQNPNQRPVSFPTIEFTRLIARGRFTRRPGPSNRDFCGEG